MTSRSSRWALVCWLALGASCNRAPKQTPEATSAPVAVASAPRPDPRRHVVIEAGDFEAGAAPGKVQRQPEWEAAPERVRLGEFEIDGTLFATAPDQPLLGVSRDEARLRCSERQGRLCTELEWERACRGPDNTLFSSGESWRPECGQGIGCESGFGVFSMGTVLEWTASTAGGDALAPGETILRGSNDPSADGARCTRRQPFTKTQAARIGFRCCYGPPNAARVKEPAESPVFTRVTLSSQRLKALLESDPKTKELATGLQVFSDPEGVNTVIARGPGDRMGFDFTTQPLAWSPTRGARYLVLAAKSGKAKSFVLAYYDLGNDNYALASSFVMEDEAGPVVFAYSPSIKPRLHFSTCWGCPGETGKVLFRAPDAVVILQP